MSDIIDDLMKPESKPRIISGGPNRQGQWIVTVVYLDPKLNQSVEGPGQIAELTVSQLNEWRKRHGA